MASSKVIKSQPAKPTKAHTRSHKVTQGHIRSHKVTQGHTRSHKVTQGHTRSHKVTQGHTRSHKVTKNCATSLVDKPSASYLRKTVLKVPPRSLRSVHGNHFVLTAR